jgi:ATP-dependent DNA ligase
LKLITGSLRIGVSARLAKLALAEWSGADIAQIEEVWHAIAPPYDLLFAWLEGRAAPPQVGELPTFCPLMLAQALEEDELAALDPRDYLAEWKWDGIRVQLTERGGEKRLHSRSGDDIGGAFPDILDAAPDAVTPDGELLVVREGARERGIEGIMLKRADSRYVAGRPKGPWFNWKRGALTIDPVLMYAQRGHGKRRHSIPITLSAPGMTTRWCRSARPIPASPMRNFAASTNGCATHDKPLRAGA